MQIVENKRFENLADHTGAAKITGVECRSCTFCNCVLTSPAVTQRPFIGNVRLIDCVDIHSHLAKAVMDEIVVDGFRTKDLTILSACAIRHVTLKGKIGKLKVTDRLPGIGNPVQLQEGFNAVNMAFYRGIDWALDISQAELEDFSLSGIPLSLIRRDPETQVVLPADVAVSRAWRQVPEFAKVWGPRVEALLKIGRGPELLLVAPKLHPDFKMEVDALNSLRRAGLIPAS